MSDKDLITVRHFKSIDSDKFEKLPAKTKQKMYEQCFQIRVDTPSYTKQADIFRIEMEAWCKENCSGLYLIEEFNTLIYFANEEDAMAFKLEWI